jgi:hypothetical protein
VRVVGRTLSITYHPSDRPPVVTESQTATLSVWGQAAQDEVARIRVGVVGLGSVGSLVAEALSRVGASRLTYIDFDRLEVRNLDRTLGATMADVVAGLFKVQVAARASTASHTAAALDLRVVADDVLTRRGLASAVDCDALVCCVDRPWPRFLLNVIAYSHLIPVIDGGVMARVKPDGTPLHVAWRIHTIGPERACMVCLGVLRRSDIKLDMDGKLDDPDYINGLSEDDKAHFSRRNVFPFSMAVAAHEVLQLVGIVTGQARIGGTGAQIYDCYPGEMRVIAADCDEDCEYSVLTATAADLTPNLRVS